MDKGILRDNIQAIAPVKQFHFFDAPCKMCGATRQITIAMLSTKLQMIAPNGFIQDIASGYNDILLCQDCFDKVMASILVNKDK